MSDNPHTDVIKDLGIYAIKATVTLNAGAFGVILANTQHLRNIQYALWTFWLGLIFSGIAIGITYYVAQRASAGLKSLVFGQHMLLMILPTLFSFLLFIGGTAVAILSY